MMRLSLLAAVFVSASLLWQQASSQGQAALTFTGNVETDFWGKRGVVTTFDGVVINGHRRPDVGVPTSDSRARAAGTSSRSTCSTTTKTTRCTSASIALVCAVTPMVTAMPDVTSPELDALGGKDLPDFTGSESFAVAIDFGDEFGGPINGQFDFVIGYPGGNAANNVLSCTMNKPNDDAVQLGRLLRSVRRGAGARHQSRHVVCRAASSARRAGRAAAPGHRPQPEAVAEQARLGVDDRRSVGSARQGQSARR
jgi:hypothetical protein